MNLEPRPDRPEAEGRHSVTFWPASCARIAFSKALKAMRARSGASRLANRPMKGMIGSDEQ